MGPDGDRLFAEIHGRGGDGLAGLAGGLLPGTDVSELIAVILEDLEKNPPEGEGEGGIRALGLILGSPEFQRH